MTRDLTGQKFGRLTAIKLAERCGTGKPTKWLCKCDCGKEKIIRGTALTCDITKSCGCLRADPRLSEEDVILNIVIGHYNESATNRDRTFNLSRDEVKNIIFNNCVYCGTEPQNSKYNRNRRIFLKFNGIDRVDNAKGYTLDNCVPCCKACNFMKRSMSVEDFLLHISEIYNFQREANVKKM